LNSPWSCRSEAAQQLASVVTLRKGEKKVRPLFYWADESGWYREVENFAPVYLNRQGLFYFYLKGGGSAVESDLGDLRIIECRSREVNMNYPGSE